MSEVILPVTGLKFNYLISLKGNIFGALYNPLRGTLGNSKLM
jgi:hypothetical protein